MAAVRVLGAGPAGSAAALSALANGAPVEIYEKTPFPRHKVCGEFLSPEAALLLDRLGVLPLLEALSPPRLTRMMLCFAGREKHGRFPEPAYGISRRSLDQMLLTEACRRGAILHRRYGEPAGTTILAAGRRAEAPRGSRLFGFKAHFTGPVNDVMELYFLTPRAYAGVSAVDGGFTNVCGLAEESALLACNFDIDAFLYRDPFVRTRLAPLRRAWKWLIVGPLVFQHTMNSPTGEHIYPAGDALCFVDPFTGSGMLSALLTGTLAGRAAAQEMRPSQYSQDCRDSLGSAYRTSSLCRLALETGLAQWLAPFVPSTLLFRLTRPNPLKIHIKK